MADGLVFINSDEGTKRVMNNTKLYAKLLGKFKEDTNITQLEAALKEGDLEKAQQAAHTLKGLAANLAFPEVYKQSLEIESQIKNKSVNPDQIGILLNIYSLTISEINKVIERYA
ncbi:MAG: Hpt domain-containing protein [Treponema sp.]|nr:Hpt domain-containing protein [Treponema sp.]MCL2271488.1 Hpt domain-containing protein [Treponema sp.]